jgi:hypothetical protein
VARAHIEFIEGFEIDGEEVTEGPLAGSTRRLLSLDEDAGDYTALCTFPAGWSGNIASSRPVELFCLQGALELDGKPLRRGCYAYVPSGSSRGLLRAIDGSQSLVMVEAEHTPEPDDPIQVIDESTMPWQHAGSDPDIPPGIVIKLLREDPDTHDWTWLAAFVPGWLITGAEMHPTVEEGFMLQGDILGGDRGAMQAGSYFWRPGMVWHGPFFSLEGGIIFLRTKGGSLATEFAEFPGWEGILNDYIAQAPSWGGLD